MRFDYGSAKPMLLKNASVGPSALRVAAAESLAQRALGLTGAELDGLPADGAVLIDRCRCVHTFGMRGPIALAWVGAEARDGSRPVVSVDASIPPCRVVAAPRGAVGVLEMRAQDPEVELEPPASLAPADRRMEGGDGDDLR